MRALYLDVEVYGDREEDLQKLFAELAEDGADTDPSGGTGDKLPPIIQDEGLGEDWEWAA